ncbi:MAG: hypothetical protein QOC89_3668 [Paraburkholderia sp.]|jgi:hypothetical protein|uniref:hypothetical protein n=1 Tax=Paraburkholderia sp. TaxID=1926495 RepID=UPI002AFEF2A5|nr:hypothetical protein [Paraburkholderia sp.]MEA3085971.1 hypothetical protein [Paraburkholderia sp.]
MLEPLSNLTDGQLQRLIYSTWDFQQALSALTFLMEECDFLDTLCHQEPAMTATQTHGRNDAIDGCKLPHKHVFLYPSHG